MKQKVLAVLVTAAMLGTSVAPVIAAEFSSGEENAVVQESEVVGSADEFSSGVNAGYDYDDEDGYDDEDDYDDDDDYDNDTVQSIKIVKGPDVDTYYYGAEANTLYDLDCGGLTAQITYKTGDTDTVTFEDRYDEAYDKWDNEYRCILEEDVNDDEEESVTIGAYHFYVEERYSGVKSDSCPVYVVSPDTLPELSQTDSGSVTTTVTTKGNRFYAKLIAQKSGLCDISYKDEEDNASRPSVFDKNFDLVSQTGDYTFKLKKGETYYIIGYLPDVTAAEVTVTYYVDIVSLELIKEPTVKYSYYGINMIDGFYAKNGEIKITYADGSSEIVPTDGANCVTKYNERFVPIYDVKPGETPNVGVYDLFYCLGNDPETDMKVTIKNIEIKSVDEMPTINGTGSKTVETLGTGSPWVRLKTGKSSVYTIESSEKRGLSIFKDYGVGFLREAPGCADLPSKATVVLEPNSEYYISAGPGMHIQKDEVTYKVSTSKYDISSKYNTNINLKSSCTYTGKALKPAVTITYGYTMDYIKLKAGRDYTVTYTNNKNVGTAKVKITGKGEFTGTVTKTFKIELGKPALKTVAKSGSAAIKASWAKLNGAVGYEVYRYTGSKWTKVATTKSTSYTDKKVKKGTTYKYKIRAYAKAGGKTVYSAYSAEKSITR